MGRHGLSPCNQVCLCCGHLSSEAPPSPYSPLQQLRKMCFRLCFIRRNSVPQKDNLWADTPGSSKLTLNHPRDQFMWWRSVEMGEGAISVFRTTPKRVQTVPAYHRSLSTGLVARSGPVRVSSRPGLGSACLWAQPLSTPDYQATGICIWSCSTGRPGKPPRQRFFTPTQIVRWEGNSSPKHGTG